MLLLGIQILLCALGAAVYMKWISREDEKRTRALLRGFFCALLAQLPLIFLLLYSWQRVNLYSIAQAGSFYWKYVLLSIISIAFCLFLFALITQRLHLEKDQTKWNGKRIFLSLFVLLFMFLAGFCIFGGRWYYDYFGKVSSDYFVFTLSQASGEATTEVSWQLTNYIIVPIVSMLAIGIFLIFWQSDIVGYQRRLSGRHIRRFFLLGSIALFLGSLVYANTMVPLFNSVVYELSPTTFYEDNYVEPTPDILHFPKGKPRNLIHIYLESIENSYYAQEQGGYMSTSLMPDLYALNQANTHFSNTNVMGGPHQVVGAEHSIAGMLNFGAGVPMIKGVYHDFPSIGDILYHQGYETSFMLGADVTWGNLDQYYLRHGHFTIKDYRWALKEGKIPKGYKQWWGYEDDKLYEYAKEELLRLSKLDRPFYFILENADTHFPDGYVSKNMKKKPFDKQYANVIFYSQSEVLKFINWLKQQSFYENTTVVVTGDHRSKDIHFFEGWDPHYERTVVNFILNDVPARPSENVMYNRDFASFDLFPTILSSMGVQIDGDRLGLGTNLYSGKPTLLEQMSWEKVDDELSKKSEFYKNYRRPALWDERN